MLCNTKPENLESIFINLMFLQFGQSFGFSPNLLQVLHILSTSFPNTHFSDWNAHHLSNSLSPTNHSILFFF